MLVDSADDFKVKLADATRNNQFKTQSASKALERKRRWITVTMANLTEFNIEPVSNWFDSGRFWEAPSTCNPWAGTTFSGCEKDGSIMTGVSGAIVYNITVGQQKYPLTVAFSNPYIGAIKCRAEFSPHYKDVWERMDSGDPYYSPDKYLGAFSARPDRSKVNISLRLASIPGQNARVEITERRWKPDAWISFWV